MYKGHFKALRSVHGKHALNQHYRDLSILRHLQELPWRLVKIEPGSTARFSCFNA